MTASEQYPLFVFGTLMDADVLRIVLNRDIDDTFVHAATLTGFRCVRISDETYPILVADPKAAVRGGLLWDLDQIDWSRIRFFESYEYELEPCRVLVESEGITEAVYYSEGVITGALEPWALDWWQKHHKQRFLQMTYVFMALYGETSVDEAETLWSELQQRYEVQRPA